MNALIVVLYLTGWLMTTLNSRYIIRDTRRKYPKAPGISIVASWILIVLGSLLWPLFLGVRCARIMVRHFE